MWFVPEASALQIRRPFRITEVSDSRDEAGPVLAGAGWAGQIRNGRERVGSFRHLIEDTLRGSGADARQQVQDAEAGDAIARVLHEPQQRKDVLDVRGVE